MKKLIGILTIAILITACGGSADEATQLNDKYKEVDEMHNMAMGHFGNLQASLNALDTLLVKAEADTTIYDANAIKTATVVREQVSKAGEDMMNWMKNHQTVEELGQTEMTFDEKMEHLEKDLQAITKNNDDCQNSIAAAKDLFEQLGLEVELTESHGKGHEHHSHGHDH